MTRIEKLFNIAVVFDLSFLGFGQKRVLEPFTLKMFSVLVIFYSLIQILVFYITFLLKINVFTIFSQNSIVKIMNMVSFTH